MAAWKCAPARCRFELIAASMFCRSKRRSTSSGRYVNQTTQITDYYKLLYASYKCQPPADASIQLYESVPLDGREGQ